MDDLTMLQQIVLGMSVFDLCSSAAHMFSTLPIPEYEYFNIDDDDDERRMDIEPIPSGIYGAKGNQATCGAQGFFLQLGYTSALYNMALSVYYLLVIKRGVRESQLQKFRLFFSSPRAFRGIRPSLCWHTLL